MKFPYIDGFDDQADVLRAFREPASALDGAELLYACDESANYSSMAIVVFRKDGQLYLVSGSHCSCYGYEDQWVAEPTTVEALRSFNYEKYYSGWKNFVDALWAEKHPDYKEASLPEAMPCEK